MKSSAEACGCFPTGKHYAGIAHLLKVDSAGVAEELPAEGAWIDMPIAFLDTETTGRDAQADRIVEVGIIVGRNGVIEQRFNWLINPQMPIPEAASKVHGITDEQVKDQPTFAEVVPAIVEAMRGAIPAAYNASFDRNFVLAEMARAGARVDDPASPPALRSNVEWLDPLVWARHIQRQEKSKALGDVAQRLGVKLENAHRASDDAEAALLVMYALAQDPRIPKLYGGLMKEQRRLGKLQEQDFARWRKPS